VLDRSNGAFNPPFYSSMREGGGGGREGNTETNGGKCYFDSTTVKW